MLVLFDFLDVRMHKMLCAVEDDILEFFQSLAYVRTFNLVIIGQENVT